MDISLLKTFLEVAKTRHFGKAADRLFLTQSAVSARIKLLESRLGVELFSRRRNDIQLTPAGVHLATHAEAIVRGWEKARHEIALGPDFPLTLSLGCPFDLWGIYVRHWSLRLRRERPELALQIELQSSDVLLQKLISGTIDLAFLFEPPQLPYLTKTQIAEIHLILLSSRPAADPAEAMSHDYYLVDWGNTFALRHAEHFPALPSPKARLGSGILALDLLLGAGGSAYLPKQLVQQQLADALLFQVPGAPIIERQAFAVYRSDMESRENIEDALRLG